MAALKLQKTKYRKPRRKKPHFSLRSQEGLWLNNQKTFLLITFSRKVHSLLFDGVMSARNGEEALKYCLWLKVIDIEDFVDSNVKESILFDGQGRGLAPLLHPEKLNGSIRSTPF